MFETTLPKTSRTFAAQAMVPADAVYSVATGAVSWSAIIAGATGAAALSLILLILGTGLGLSSISPWTGKGASASALGLSTILWISFTQLAAAGMGGYLAGRLRARWVDTHTDEVYFRDTAHGFLAWALATLVTAAMLTSTIGSGAQAAAPVVASAAAAATPVIAGPARQDGSAGQGYFVDSLFRKDAIATTAGPSSPQADAPVEGPRANTEVGRIFASAMTGGTLAADDSRYIGQLVAQGTGLSQADAEKRVADTFARMQTKAKEAEAAARDAADTARKAAAYAALWLFVSLLVGAFCASFAATYGGRQRDQV